MTPLRFGRQHRQLIGLMHTDAQARGPRHGVVICNPFGQESIRTHRLFRVLADRLQRMGIDVLRFDYFGTGDSDGDDAEGDIDGWIDDIQTAHAELLRRANCSQVTWIGARLGATLALLAARDASPRPQHLIAWDPILNGEAYLAHLADKSVAAVKASFSLPSKAWLAAASDTPPKAMREALGFAVSEHLARQLSQIKSEIFLQSDTALTIISSEAGAATNEIQALCRLSQSQPQFIESSVQFDWTSEEAMNTALVPSDMLDLIARQFHEAFA